MSHDIGHQIARFIAQHHANDKNFFKKLYCDPVFRIISRYKKQIYERILLGKSYWLHDFQIVSNEDKNENTRIWINITSGTIVNDPITNNSTTLNSTTLNSTTLKINPNIIPLYFYDIHEKKALTQIVNELDLKIILHNSYSGCYFSFSWEHWKIE